LLYFGHGIGRAAGEAAYPHHLYVGNIIAHIQNLFGVYPVLGAEMTKRFHLGAGSQIYVCNAQHIKSLDDGRRGASRDNAHEIALLYGTADGVAVFGVVRPKEIAALGN
jgi:hypothetical protein